MDLARLRDPFPAEDIEWAAIGRLPYEVSATGRVRRTGAGRGVGVGDELTPVVNPVSGYAAVNLYDGTGRGGVTYRYVHRLVAEAFVPNPDSKPHVNHIDMDRTNNAASNLEWVTPAENNAHARGSRRPTYATGDGVHTTKLNPVAVAVIRYCAAAGYSHRRIGRAYGVDHKTIGAIVHRRTWGQV